MARRLPLLSPSWGMAALGIIGLVLVLLVATSNAPWFTEQTGAPPLALPSSLPDPTRAVATPTKDSSTAVDSVSPPAPPTAAAVAATALTRVLTMNPLWPWYGITNQLMCYAAALRYGIDDRRAVLFPVDERAKDVLPAYALIDVNATQARLGDAVVIALPSDDDRLYGYGTRPPRSEGTRPHSPLTVPAAWYPPVSMNKKKLHLPERTVYRSRDPAALKHPRAYLVQKVYKRSAEWPFVRHHNFFMRFAWPPRADATARRTDLDECRLMAAFEPVRVIRDYVDALLDRLQGAKGTDRYVALHLRIEPDAKLLRQQGARSPSPAQFRAFLQDVVVPMARKHGASVAYLCLGKLPTELAEVVAAWNSGSDAAVRVVYRALLLEMSATKRLDGTALRVATIPPLPKFEGKQRGVHQSVASGTQDHYASFVELQVLVRAAAAAVTEFSSLKFSVFSRRCSGFDRDAAVSRGDDTGVFTVNILPSGDIAPLKRFDCSTASQLGWCGPTAWGED